MREIKFRAWDFNDKKLLPVDSLRLSIEGSIVINEAIGFPAWELMQYTGLKDKNGHEIYEGDIVKLCEKHWSPDWEDTAVVKYEEGCFFPWGTGDWEESSCNYEIIGNVHESPELLSKEPVSSEV